MREIGFLDGIRVPEEVKRDVARVQVGDFFVPAEDPASGRLLFGGRDIAYTALLVTLSIQSVS